MQKEVEEKVKHFISLILSSIDANTKIEIVPEGDQFRVVVLTEDKDSILVGDNGEVLSALQHIVRTLVHKYIPNDRTHFIIDVGSFRRIREDLLTSKIPSIISKSVLGQGKTLVLVGLSSYERLLVHRCLADIKGIQTTSVGMSSNRKLLVMPTSETGSTGLDNAIILDIAKLQEIQVS